MSNKYSGYCVDCGHGVGPNHGDLVKVGGKWQVQCGRKRSAGASSARKIAPREPHHRDGEQIDQVEMLARAAELAQKAGVEVLGTTAISYVAQGVIERGEARKTKKDGWVLVVALGAYDKYYLSQDALDDQDDFSSRPGWYEDQHYWGVRCSEPASVRTERDAREAKAAADQADRDNKRAEWNQALAVIPADYIRRHGSLVSGTVAMTSAAGTETSEIHDASEIFARLVWTDVHAYAEPYAHESSRIDCRHTLRRAELADGRYIYEHQTIRYDDYRTTFLLPADIYEQVLGTEVARRAITREKAEAWLAQYRGCVDTDIYEFAASHAA